MKKLIGLCIALTLILTAFAVDAQVLVVQGAGSTTQRPWGVLVKDSNGNVISSFGGGPSAGYTTAGAPAASVSISAASAVATGLTAGATYRVACTVSCFYRTGSGTPTALTSDSLFIGPAVEYIGLKTGSTAIAFITSAGTGTCTVTLLTAAP
jgi:hypothetical protein